MNDVPSNSTRAPTRVAQRPARAHGGGHAVGHRRIGLPGELGSVLAKIKQQRRLDVAPRQPSEAEPGHILNASMTNW